MQTDSRMGASCGKKSTSAGEGDAPLPVTPLGCSKADGGPSNSSSSAIRTLHTRGELSDEFTVVAELGRGSFGVVSKVPAPTRHPFCRAPRRNTPPSMSSRYSRDASACQVRRNAGGQEFASKAVPRAKLSGARWKKIVAEVESWERLSSPAHPGIVGLIQANARRAKRAYVPPRPADRSFSPAPRPRPRQVVESPDTLYLLTEVMNGGELFDTLQGTKTFSEQARDRPRLSS